MELQAFLFDAHFLPGDNVRGYIIVSKNGAVPSIKLLDGVAQSGVELSIPSMTESTSRRDTGISIHFSGKLVGNTSKCNLLERYKNVRTSDQGRMEYLAMAA